MSIGTGALLTDLYELTMLQAYWRSGMCSEAVFELFVRSLPPGRNFLVAAGLEQVLEYLGGLRFSLSDLSWMSGCGLFEAAFVDSIAKLRFKGEVSAMAEGTVFFPGEPILRVTAPLPQAQLVETRLLNIITSQTMIASKAARCVLSARGRTLVEFGLRRAHGGDAGLWAARASYLAGFAGTSNAAAAPLFGIPVYGTMGHSFIEAHESEELAFEAFTRANPRRGTLLLDTYDVLQAAKNAARLGLRLRSRGLELDAVRLDSGDLAAQAKEVRRILDAAGLSSVRIFASGDLDEWELRGLLSCGAPIDGFGIGTRLATSADAPYLDSVYKLQEYAGKPRRKRSQGKQTWPGRKQVWRHSVDGRLVGDLVALESEAVAGTLLLEPVMKSGRRAAPGPQLEEIRQRVRRQLQALPEELRSLEGARTPYPVNVSTGVHALADSLDARLSLTTS